MFVVYCGSNGIPCCAMLVVFPSANRLNDKRSSSQFEDQELVDRRENALSTSARKIEFEGGSTPVTRLFSL